MNVGFLVSFSSGVVSVLSPCVLPLVPIVLAHSLLNKKFSQILSFILGFFLVFAIITLLTVVFTAAINYYLFYFRILASLMIIGIVIFFIINKNILNVSFTPKYKGEKIGSFLVGFMTCLAWSPCYSPYIMAVAAYSAFTGSVVYSIINVTLFAMGFSFALVIVGILTSKINFKRIMKFSDEIRVISGIIICMAGFYLLINLL